MYCCAIHMPIRCQMPGHIMKRFYNLQVNFNIRSQYTRAKLSRCTRANHLESRSQTEKTIYPGLYKRTTSFRYCTYVENWLYVCRHGWGRQFSLSARDSKWLSLVRRANFASVLWPFLNLPAGCRTFSLYVPAFDSVGICIAQQYTVFYCYL